MLIIHPTVIFFGAIFLMWAACSFAQEGHNHPEDDVAIHEKFYSTWQRPDQRTSVGDRYQSCCNKQDCYPAQIKREAGSYWYKRREDGKWLIIPEENLEYNQQDARESPDGRNHVCAQPPGSNDKLFCAVLGSGQ